MREHSDGCMLLDGGDLVGILILVVTAYLGLWAVICDLTSLKEKISAVKPECFVARLEVEK